MVRKDYKNFALLLSRLRIALKQGIALEDAIDDFELELCRVFKADNKNFDVKRFLATSEIVK